MLLIKEMSTEMRKTGEGKNENSDSSLKAKLEYLRTSGYMTLGQCHLHLELSYPPSTHSGFFLTLLALTF